MKKYRTNTQIILIILIFFIHIPVYAYNPHVFKIVSKDCSLCPPDTEKENAQTAQTGFTIQGKSGIITALHGVVGRNSIIAHQDADGGQVFKGLKIASVDIKHDLALLSSDELNSKTDGFETLGHKIDYRGSRKIQCIGYPLNLPSQIDRSHLTLDSPKNLWKLLTSYKNSPDEESLREKLNKRQSPDTNLEVLNIEGQLIQGYSGAPILNHNNKVIGVASGGLPIGNGISWAIPYNDIKWEPFSSKDKEQTKKLDRLARLNDLGLFTFGVLAFQKSNGELITWQEPRAEMMTWIEARNYVKEMNRKSFRGYNDWRLPAVGELEDLAQFIKTSPGSYSDVDKLYWSSENAPESRKKSFAVNLRNARMEWDEFDERVVKRSNGDRLAVRLVRSLVP